MDESPSQKPTVINLGAPKGTPNKSFLGKKIVLAVSGVLVLAVGLGLGTFLVQRQQSQDVRSKAASNICRGLHPYPVSPTHQQSNVSTTPTFQWKYYEPDTPSDTECTGLTGYYNSLRIYSCTAKGADGFRTVSPKAGPGCKLGQKVDANAYPALPDDCTQIIWCSTATRDGQPFTELAPSSCWWLKSDGQPDYGKNIASNPLSPNSEYWWANESGHSPGFVMWCPGGAWRFNTAETITPTPTPVPGTAACQQVRWDKDLATLKPDDTVTFTGTGTTTADGDKIDKIEFTVTKDGVPTVTPVITTQDSSSTTTLKVWKAMLPYKISDYGDFKVTIRAHWLKADGTDGGWKE